MKEFLTKTTGKINDFTAKMTAGKLGVIRAAILVLGLFVMSVVWPMGKFTTSEVSEAAWDGNRFSGPSNEEGYIRQEFSPNFEDLTSVAVYAVNEADSFDTIETFIRIYDSFGNLLIDKRVNLKDYGVPGWIDVEVDLSVTPGDIYFLTVGGTDGDLFLALCSDEAGNAENGALYYKEVPSGGTSAVVRYTYERPWGIKRIIIADIAIALVTLALYCLATCAISKMSEDKVAIAEKNTKRILCGIVLAVAAAACVAIAGFKVFTADTVNVIVLCLGTCFTAAIIVYAIISSPLMTCDEKAGNIGERAVSLLRSSLLAAAVIMTCMYQNGSTDFEKGLWTRRMIVLFAMFLYSLGKKRQIWNLPGLVWSLMSIGIGKYYIGLHSDHPEHISTATSTAWVIWAAGLVIIQLIYRLKEKEYQNLKAVSLPYTIALFAFWILCCVFSYGRTWPFIILAVFGVGFIFCLMSSNRVDVLELVCNGFLMSFFAAVLFSIYRRPYQYYMMTRYPGIFFTVTVTATFYLLGAAAALTRLLICYEKDNRRGIIFSLIALGTVAAFMFFTASRTGIMGFAAELVFAFAVWQYLRKKKDKRKFEILKGLASVLLAFAVMYVTQFGLARMIPALVHNPFYYGFESFCEYIHPDTPLDGGERTGEEYVTFQVSVGMLLGRVFTTGEDSDAFGSDLTSLTVHAATLDTDATQETAVEEYSNGRMDIFKAYISALGIKGHESMDLETEDGEVLMHAHNTYIQLAYDFGAIMGVAFLIFCLFVLIRSMRVALYDPLPLIMTVGFGTAGLVEWIYHPMNPIGFAFILICMLLTKKKETK